MSATAVTSEAVLGVRMSERKPSRMATDDEILGLRGEGPQENSDDRTGTAPGAGETKPQIDSETKAIDPKKEYAEPENLKAVFDAKPELRQAWQEVRAYRDSFATPEEARAATRLLGDLDTMDSLFFSGGPEQHAQLALMISKLGAKDFVSLAKEMAAVAHSIQQGSEPDNADAEKESRRLAGNDKLDRGRVQDTAQIAREQLFRSVNAAAVQGVIEAIEGQVSRLLPDGVSKATHHRLVGEIYREIDASLRNNRQLGEQLRTAINSGDLDSGRQKAIVSLVTARARQALPGIARRVLGEWSSAVLATHREGRERQRATERRIDIVGSSNSGNDGRRPMRPNDIDYSRMSDSDILNL